MYTGELTWYVYRQTACWSREMLSPRCQLTNWWIERLSRLCLFFPSPSSICRLLSPIFVVSRVPSSDHHPMWFACPGRGEQAHAGVPGWGSCSRFLPAYLETRSRWCACFTTKHIHLFRTRYFKSPISTTERPSPSVAF